MKVTRKMLHPDLQPAAVYRQQLIGKYLFRYEWSTKLAHRIIGAQLAKLGGNTHSTVDIEERYLPTTDGDAEIRVKIYRPRSFAGEDSAPQSHKDSHKDSHKQSQKEKRKLPPMLYTHGGGYITGSPEPFEGTIARFMQRRPCVVIAPAYRNALTKPYPAAFDDCYMTLLWVRDHADELGVDCSNFMIAGHSAGGGLTAALTHKARDTGDVNVALQMPFYPMIDDQQPSNPARKMDGPGWDTKTNAFGWASYLKELRAKNAEIPAYAAPSRNTDYSNFPPTITFVGEFEPFYWETVEYVRQLREAGVDVAFKEYAKCTHGPDMIAPDSELGKDAIAFSLDNYADFYDRYVAETAQ